MNTRVLFIVNNPAFFLSHRRNVARAVAENGWSVHVATPPGDGSAEIQAEGFIWHPIPLSRSGWNPLAELRTLFALVRLLQGLRPSLIHTVTIKPVLYTGLLAPLLRTPAIVHQVSGLGTVFIGTGVKAHLRRTLVMIAYRMAFRHPRSRVILENSDDGAVLAPALRPEQPTVIHGAGVDPGDFPPTSEPDGVPIVMLASRMLRTKGVGEFVEAARHLDSSGTQARFVLVGSPDVGNPDSLSAAELQAWSEEGPIEWWGYRSDMSKILSQASIVCLPSYREGLPRVLLEAAAAQRAIITTDVPGCREVAADGSTSLLVPPRDATSLANAIKRLLDDPHLRHVTARAGRERFLAEFTSEKVVAETIEVYLDLMTEGGQGRADRRRSRHDENRHQDLTADSRGRG